MSDLEKVIKGLEICIDYISADCPKECPYYESCLRYDARYVFQPMLRDALALLKEQERRINQLEERLRLLEYGNQDILQSGLMPAT